VVAFLCLLADKGLFLVFVHHAIQLERAQPQEGVDLLDLLLINDSFNRVFVLSNLLVHDLGFDQVVQGGFEVLALDEELGGDAGGVRFHFHLGIRVQSRLTQFDQLVSCQMCESEPLFSVELEPAVVVVVLLARQLFLQLPVRPVALHLEQQNVDELDIFRVFVGHWPLLELLLAVLCEFESFTQSKIIKDLPVKLPLTVLVVPREVIVTQTVLVLSAFYQGQQFH